MRVRLCVRVLGGACMCIFLCACVLYSQYVCMLCVGAIMHVFVRV